MAIAHVQSVSAQATTSVASISTASITTTSGNLLHCGRSNFAATDAATPVTPDPGNGWVNAALVQNAGGGGAVKIGMGRARNITGATGTFTYTVSAADSPSITISEFSGIDQTTPVVFGPTSRNNQTQADPHLSASLTNTGVANALYVVSGADAAGAPAYVANAPAGYTIATSKTNNSAGQDIWTGYLIVSTVAARTLDTNIQAGSFDDVTYVVVYQVAAAATPWAPRTGLPQTFDTPPTYFQPRSAFAILAQPAVPVLKAPTPLLAARPLYLTDPSYWQPRTAWAVLGAPAAVVARVPVLPVPRMFDRPPIYDQPVLNRAPLVSAVVAAVPSPYSPVPVQVIPLALDQPPRRYVVFPPAVVPDVAIPYAPPQLRDIPLAMPLPARVSIGYLGTAPAPPTPTAGADLIYLIDSGRFAVQLDPDIYMEI